MSTERDQLWQRLGQVDANLQRLEVKVDHRIESSATREWVQEIIFPIQQAVTRMEGSVTGLADDLKTLFGMHDQLLKTRATQEQQITDERIKALQEASWVNLIKKRWVIVLGIIVLGFFFMIGVAAKLLEVVLRPAVELTK